MHAPDYDPTVSFANEESNQVAGRSTVRTVALDTELANISDSINGLNTNLKLVQRDDGKLNDAIVEPYAFSEQARALIATGGTPRGMWAAGTAYAVGDVVQSGATAYICYTAHTSGVSFVAAGFWIAISGDGQSLIYAQQAAASAATATTKASDAATSAGQSAASAATATTKANDASAYATAAAASQNAANTSANSANAAMLAAQTAYDDFDDRYLGPKAAAPTLDNDGNALIAGALYFNTTLNQMMVYGGVGPGWLTAGGGGAKGSGGDAVFFENDQTVNNDYTITAGKNALSAGPIAIANGKTVTVPSGATWTVV